MNQPDPEPPFSEQDGRYSVDFIATLSGVSSETILHYQEHGMVRARDGHFDDEALHTLRQIDHLQRDLQASLPAAKMILGLLNEIEQLRAALRARR